MDDTPTTPSSRIISVNSDSNDWTTIGGLEYSSLYIGPPLDPGSPVAIFVRAGREVGDRVAGRRVHPTAELFTVLDGTVQLDGRWLSKGDVQLAAAGVPHGDLVFGPDGATVMMFFASRRGMIPQFEDPGDQERFDSLILDRARSVAEGREEADVALLPARPAFTPRRGIRVDVDSPGGGETPGGGEKGLIWTAVDDDALPWSHNINVRTAVIVVGDASDVAAPTIAVINAQPGPGDRLRGRHIHTTDAVNFVVRGAMYMDGDWIHSGEAKVVSGHFEYGDALIGPDGVQFLEIFAAQPGAIPQFVDPLDQEFYDARRAAGHMVERVSL
jgi:hypothetical protein